MSDHQSLLIELGTEELPPNAVDELAATFARGVCEGLTKRLVAADVENARVYCSPRRLAVLVPGVARMQPDQMQERRGPAVVAALDSSGAPTKALAGFARSCGVEIGALEKLETDKGAWFVHRAVVEGRTIAQVVPEVLVESLGALPIAKPMRWSDHEYSFVRPAHWLVILHGAEVIDAEVFGLKSGRQSRGHRFHHPHPVHVADADSWYSALFAARVIASTEERKQRIRDESRNLGIESGFDLQPKLSENLLAELAALTEWPVPILCKFDEEFLEVPHEALEATMVANQRFIPMLRSGMMSVEERAARGPESTPVFQLSSWFVGVANIKSKRPEVIRKGYERVIRPRFADAKFFYDEDRKQRLETHQKTLKTVTYQSQLGSVWDKCVRVAELARVIANRIGVDAALATRAASLSKCDLMTRMVGEFPELQGIMGWRYADSDGENPDVARALAQMYLPRFANDAIAGGKVGQVLAVAERLDTLAGIFAAGLKPTGNKDPFALRRTALGLARTLIEGGLEIDLRAQLYEHLEMVQAQMRSVAIAAHEQHRSGPVLTADNRDLPTTLTPEIYEFILDRLRGYYAEQGVTTEMFEAVRSLAPGDLTDFDRRLRAVVAFAQLPEAAALAAANKRIGNLLRQADEENVGTGTQTVDETLFEAGAEQDFAKALSAAETDAAPSIAARDYLGLFQRLARLRTPVDAYFDGVMVMVDDAAVRRNRLAMLRRLQDLFHHVADIGRLAVE
ncbi:MAG: glycine--tRNA ligase subunit beta [Rhodanobacteraceae bacterium]